MSISDRTRVVVCATGIVMIFGAMVAIKQTESQATVVAVITKTVRTITFQDHGSPSIKTQVANWAENR